MDNKAGLATEAYIFDRDEDIKFPDLDIPTRGNEKKNQINKKKENLLDDVTSIVFTDWQSPVFAVSETLRVAKFFGGYIYELPSGEGKDVTGFIVSKRPLSKKEIDYVDAQGSE